MNFQTDFDMGIWQACTPFDVEDETYKRCDHVDQLPIFLSKWLSFPQIVPEWEMIVIRVLFFILFVIEGMDLKKN